MQYQTYSAQCVQWNMQQCFHRFSIALGHVVLSYVCSCEDRTKDSVSTKMTDATSQCDGRSETCRGTLRRTSSVYYMLDMSRQHILETRLSVKNWQNFCRKKQWMNERAQPGKSYEPTNFEHWANTVSHGAMIIPSILAGELLLYTTHHRRHHLETNYNQSALFMDDDDDPTHLHYEVSARIYGASLVALYLVSTMFHWITWSKCDHPTKTIRLSDNCCGSALWEFFHLFDRAIIFAFIAGSYTPWLMLNSIHPSLAWLSWGIWLFVFVGTGYSFFFLEKYKLVELLLYLAQGVLPALALSTSTDADIINSLSVGGFFYLSGVLAFKSDGWIPCAHAIWHLFVVAGSVAHFWSCYCYLYYID